MSEKTFVICDGCLQIIPKYDLAYLGTIVKGQGLFMDGQDIPGRGHLCQSCNAIVSRLIKEGYLEFIKTDISDDIDALKAEEKSKLRLLGWQL